MHRITDKRFHYTPSFSTDLKKRFAQLIREQRAVSLAAAKAKTKPVPNTVVPMARRA
ncbi:MAG: hypothetical protein ABI630_05300 [Betaproteobacteria bacterium]